MKTPSRRRRLFALLLAAIAGPAAAQEAPVSFAGEVFR